MFGPFDTIPDQRAMQTSCLGSFSVIWVPKLLLTSARNWIFWPKNGQIWPKTDIFGQISAFFAHLVPYPTKNQCELGTQMGFLLRGYQNFCFLPQILGIGQIRPRLAQKMCFLKHLSCQVIWCSVGLWFGCAGCILQET